MVYEVDGKRAALTVDWRVVGPASAMPLRPAAEMLVVYKGVTESLPFLLLG